MSIQGFEPRGSIAGDLTQATFPFIVSNGVTVTAGNPVALVSGYVENIDAIDSGDVGVLGVAIETVTGDSSSTEAGILCDPSIVYYNDADGDVAQADVGKAYQTLISSGEAQIDESTGAADSANKFVLIKKDPDSDKDASKGLWKIYTSQLSNRSDDS